jgi:hypothetical protein
MARQRAFYACGSASRRAIASGRVLTTDLRISWRRGQLFGYCVQFIVQSSTLRALFICWHHQVCNLHRRQLSC